MKKILAFVAIAIVSISVLLSSCYKQTEYQPSMAGTIDSIAFAASGTGIVSQVVSGTLTMTGTTTIFTPGTTFNPAIKIVVPTAIGTYAINNNASAVVYTSATGSGGSKAVSGQVTVLNNASGKVQGNFTFTTADGTTVTNGQFTTKE